MRVDGVDASMLAAKAAQAEEVRTGELPPPGRSSGGGAAVPVRTLRVRVMRALAEARAANAPLAEAVRELVEAEWARIGGDDARLAEEAEDPYPDEVAAFDLIQSVAVAYSQLGKWVASLEGRESLARWVRLDMAPAAPQGVRRVMVAADGHSWELFDLAEFHPGVREGFERRHGELLEVTLTPHNFEDPNSLVRVDCGDINMIVEASATQDWANLYAVIVEQRAKLRVGELSG